jgi:hypothetical protein
MVPVLQSYVTWHRDGLIKAGYWLFGSKKVSLCRLGPCYQFLRCCFWTDGVSLELEADYYQFLRGIFLNRWCILRIGGWQVIAVNYHVIFIQSIVNCQVTFFIQSTVFFNVLCILSCMQQNGYKDQVCTRLPWFVCQNLQTIK